MWGWLRQQWRRRHPPPPPVIEADETGFAVIHEGHRTVYPWSCVTRMAAYKQDLFTTDEIILVVEIQKQQLETIQLSEEWKGFTELFGPMERELGVNPSWYLEIMTPAFEAKPTVLYMRSIDDGEPPMRSD
jgi:hypothetical protein